MNEMDARIDGTFVSELTPNTEMHGSFQLERRMSSNPVERRRRK